MTCSEEGTVTVAFGGDLLLAFFTALGVVIGGSVIGSLATLLTTGSPLHTMYTLAQSVKVWAVVVAMGGTFPAIRALESGLWGGEFLVLLRQVGTILAGFSGAYCGFWLITLVAGGE